jgi:hypothetical protein
MDIPDKMQLEYIILRENINSLDPVESFLGSVDHGRFDPGNG